MPDGFVRRLLRVHGTQSVHRLTDPTPVESMIDVLTVDIDNLNIEDGATPPPVVGLKAAWKLSFRTADEPYARQRSTAPSPGDFRDVDLETCEEKQHAEAELAQ